MQVTHKISVLLLGVFLLVACGTYRSGSGGYRGMGEYRGAGDDSGGVAEAAEDRGEDSGEASVYSEAEIRGKNSSSKGYYIPRSGFKVFWPVNNVKLNRGFRPSSDKNHDGIDLGGRRGTPILAAHEGLVIYAGKGFRGYGKMVLLEYNGEWASLYGHLNKIAVREGQILRAGDPIGEMGATGRATGVHLHFELMRNRLPVDPMKWLGETNRYTRR